MPKSKNSWLSPFNLFALTMINMVLLFPATSMKVDGPASFFVFFAVLFFVGFVLIGLQHAVWAILSLKYDWMPHSDGVLFRVVAYWLVSSSMYVWAFNF